MPLALQADIDVELTMPERRENRPLFMLRAELLAPGGTVLQRGHRALLLPQRLTLVQTARHLALLPLYLVGILRESEVVRVRSLLRHREAARAPLAAVRVWLQAHLESAPPPLAQAGLVRVDINRSAPPLASRTRVEQGTAILPWQSCAERAVVSIGCCLWPRAFFLESSHCCCIVLQNTRLHVPGATSQTCCRLDAVSPGALSAQLPPPHLPPLVCHSSDAGEPLGHGCHLHAGPSLCGELRHGPSGCGRQ